MDASANSQPLAREPLYQQVCAHLERQIATGKWKPNAALPSESDLAWQLGVSTGTVRKALDRLVADRLVVRRQGRGTFVIDHALPEAASRFERLRQRNGKRVACRAQLLQKSSGNPTPIERDQLQICADEPVVRTRRLWYTPIRPLMLEETCLATSRLPGLKPDEVGDWSITALAQQHGVYLIRALEKVRLEPASHESAALLKIRPETILLRLDRIISSTHDAPIEWRSGCCHLQDEYYLADLT
jgi:GntR family transcriptional regulator